SASDPSEVNECGPGVLFAELDGAGTASGTTAGAMNHFQGGPSCGSPTTGPDLVYHYRVAAGVRVVRATLTTTSWPAILYVRRDPCDDPGAQLACEGPDHEDRVTITDAAAGDNLYLFVDSA